MGFLSEVLTENHAAFERDDYFEGLPLRGPRRRPSLRQAILKGSKGGALLAEFKRVSPGQADPVLPPRTVAEFVRAAERADVAGFSCLATPARFGGSPRDVQDVVRASRRPVLFKDFVVSDRQLEAAERSGASAVLLVARLASVAGGLPSLVDLTQAAHDRGLEVLLEFHAEAELSEARGVAADMFGVNVRDLDSLRINRPTAEATLRSAQASGLRPLLGLSGVESPAEAGRFWGLGCDGILVGTALARSPAPEDFLRSLRRPDGRRAP